MRCCYCIAAVCGLEKGLNFGMAESLMTSPSPAKMDSSPRMDCNITVFLICNGTV